MESILKQLPFWAHLNSGERAAVLGASYYKEFAADEVIYAPYCECPGAIAVERGIVRGSLRSKDGKEFTLFRLRKGEVCVLSMSCVLSAVTFDVELAAEQPCRLLMIPIQTFNSLAQSNLYVENFAYKKATERFSDVVAALEQVAFLTLEQRIVAFLLDEAAALYSDTIPITHEELAKNIASSRESVTRALRQMAKAGWLTLARGKIELLDKPTLYKQT